MYDVCITYRRKISIMMKPAYLINFGYYRKQKLDGLDVHYTTVIYLLLYYCIVENFVGEIFHESPPSKILRIFFRELLKA